MNEEKFWRLIDDASPHPEFSQYLEKELEKLSEEEIIEFECILREKIILANHFDIMAAQKIIFDYVSDDTYLDFRCALISLGQEKFEEIIQNPDNLHKFIEPDENLYFPDYGDLFYIPTKVFEKKTGKKEDKNFPRDICSQRGLDYYKPAQKGRRWKGSELSQRLPGLWKKFKH